MSEEEKYKAHNSKLNNELKLAEKFEVAKTTAEEGFKDRQNEKKRL